MPPAATVYLDLGDNGQTVTLGLGQDVLVTVPNPSERDISRETVSSSNTAVLGSLLSAGTFGGSKAVMRVPFEALQAGSATLSATGPFQFTVQVEVTTG
ncbi:MAG: hypothetical protein ACREOD_02555 [Candidatus Dormibacteria bacterium]